MIPAAYAEIVQRDARRWEAMAKHRLGMTLEQHRAGESALEPGELGLLGDVRGQRILHLACAVDDGITMATHGARVVGVDISETHVDARSRGSREGQSAGRRDGVAGWRHDDP